MYLGVPPTPLPQRLKKVHLLVATLLLVAAARADDAAIFEQIVALSKQAVALSDAGKDQEASELYYKMLGLNSQVDPGHSRKRFLLHNRGVTFQNMEDYRRAYADETDALASPRVDTRDPDDAAIYTERAKVLIAYERFEEAEADLKKAIESHPLADSYAVLAPLYDSQGDTKGARSAWESAAKLDGRYQEQYQSALVHALQEVKDTAFFNKTPAPGDDAEALVKEAYDFQKSGDYEAAALRYAKVIAISPNKPSGYKGLADTRLRQKHPKEYALALEHYSKAVNLGMNTAPVWGNRALLLYRMKDWEGGRLSAAISLGLDSKVASVWWTRALCESRLGLPEAQTSKAQAIALDGEYAKDVLDTEPDSVIALNQSQVQEARAAHDTKAVLEMLMERAKEVRYRGRVAEWRAVDGEVKSLLGHDAMEWWVYGLKMNTAKAPEEAMAAYRKAIALAPKDFTYRLALAKQQALLDQWEQSHQTLEEAATLDTTQSANQIKSAYSDAQFTINRRQRERQPTATLTLFQQYLKDKFPGAFK